MTLIAFLASFIEAPMGRGAEAAGLLGIMVVARTLGGVLSGQVPVYLPYRIGSVAIVAGAGLLLLGAVTLVIALLLPRGLSAGSQQGSPAR
jgi:hypothetical protein